MEDSGKNGPFKMAGGLEDSGIFRRKITLFKMTGGLEDWRIQDDFKRKNYSFLNDWRIGGLEHWSIGGEHLDN